MRRMIRENERRRNEENDKRENEERRGEENDKRERKEEEWSEW